MSQIKGAQVVHQIVPESAYMTPGATGEQVNVVSQSLVPEEQRDTDPTLTGFRGQVRSVAGARNVAGQVPIVLAPEDVGLWLKHLIGAPTTSGAGPYQHVFTPAFTGANALPVGFHWQADYGAGIAAASRYLRLKGCRIQQGVFTFSPNGMQQLQLDVIGSDFAQSNTDLDSTPVTRGHTAWDGANLSLVVGGGSPKNIKFASLQLTIANDLDQDLRAIGNGGVRVALPEGFVMVSGQGVMLFDHEDTIDTVLSGNDTEMAITLTRGDGLGSAGNESMVINIGDLVFGKTAPPVEGPRGLRMPVSFQAHRIGTSEIDLSVTLKNAVSAIT